MECVVLEIVGKIRFEFDVEDIMDQHESKSNSPRKFYVMQAQTKSHPISSSNFKNETWRHRPTGEQICGHKKECLANSEQVNTVL
jgi:hypothetical protein